MSQTAIVSTQGDVLNVRSRPNGEIVDTLANGTKVTVTGSAVRSGNWNWVPIGPDRWVAREFLNFVPASEQPPSTSLGLGGAKVVATQTSQMIAGGLKVYKTELIDAQDRVIDRIRCVSGRVGLQDPNDVPGSQTPIPFGVYTFDVPGRVEYAPGEFGGVWSPVTPSFETNRGGFGLHYDPSTFENSSQSGTAGCLATPTPAEREVMTNFIVGYKPLYLIVREGR